jgi:lipoprotein-anchoring transpeptidase ErfK/SrfK
MPSPARRLRTRRLRTLFATIVVVLLALAGACGGVGASAPTAIDQATGAPPLAATEPAGAEPAPVARPATDTAVHVEPWADDVAQVLPARNELGSPLALVVLDERDGWLEVQLPTRPNGSSGWIRADTVEVREVVTAVHVDLDARTLTVIDGGQVVLESAVAIGAPDTPTPRGSWYVTDRLDTADPGGSYGPYALGLSVHSEVLTDFAGGDGQVGIHGTDVPGSIGQAVSNGCIRVPNDVVVELARLLPLGTPVSVS